MKTHSLPSYLTNEAFVKFCLEVPNMRVEQNKFGKVFQLPYSTYEIGSAEAEILTDLNIWNRKTKLGKTFSPSTMFILPDDEKRMPDAAWVTAEKHKKLSKWQRKKFARVVPDFIIEVRSPTDNLTDLKDKIKNVWIANGVRLAWLIDVEAETAWVFTPESEPKEIRGLDNELLGGDVLPGFVFDMRVFKED